MPLGGFVPKNIVGRYRFRGTCMLHTRSGPKNASWNWWKHNVVNKHDRDAYKDKLAENMRFKIWSMTNMASTSVRGLVSDDFRERLYDVSNVKTCCDLHISNFLHQICGPFAVEKGSKLETRLWFYHKRNCHFLILVFLHGFVPFFSTAKFSKFIGNVACEGASPHTSIQLLPERGKILSASLGVSVCVCNCLRLGSIGNILELDQLDTFCKCKKQHSSMTYAWKRTRTHNRVAWRMCGGAKERPVA
jgi:hypothetical protein